jgi:hypothetical protein
VLPIDGDADPGTRTQVNAMIQKSARAIDGTVTVADTTFADTAAAVGCDPRATACVDTVLTALAVDELVWGTARASREHVTIVVKRATQGHVRDQTIAVDPKSPESSAPGLAPLFPGAAGATSADSEARAGSASDPMDRPLSVAWSHDKKLGVGFAAGGGAALLIGLALWLNERDIQSQIDATPTPTTPEELSQLKALEDRGASYALWGNIMVATGVVVSGFGAYYLWKDHKAHVTTVAPVRVDGGSGAVLVVGGRW